MHIEQFITDNIDEWEEALDGYEITRHHEGARYKFFLVRHRFRVTVEHPELRGGRWWYTYPSDDWNTVYGDFEEYIRMIKNNKQAQVIRRVEKLVRTDFDGVTLDDLKVPRRWWQLWLR